VALQQLGTYEKAMKQRLMKSRDTISQSQRLRGKILSCTLLDRKKAMYALSAPKKTAGQKTHKAAVDLRNDFSCA